MPTITLCEQRLTPKSASETTKIVPPKSGQESASESGLLSNITPADQGGLSTPQEETVKISVTDTNIWFVEDTIIDTHAPLIIPETDNALNINGNFFCPCTTANREELFTGLFAAEDPLFESLFDGYDKYQGSQHVSASYNSGNSAGPENLGDYERPDGHLESNGYLESNEYPEAAWHLESNGYLESSWHHGDLDLLLSNDTKTSLFSSMSNTLCAIKTNSDTTSLYGDNSTSITFDMDYVSTLLHLHVNTLAKLNNFYEGWLLETTTTMNAKNLHVTLNTTTTSDIAALEDFFSSHSIFSNITTSFS